LDPACAIQAAGASVDMRTSLALVIAGVGLAAAIWGCANTQLKEMQQQVDQQKAQIENQGREIEEMRAQQQQQAASYAMPPPGSCDNEVMRHALAHGDDQYAAGKYDLALGYYQDASKACPGNASVELDLARVYETMGDRRDAQHHYQLALNAAEANDPPVADQARQGIARVGGGQQ
jgi:tetratricopeptide (TPR) repeat protein